VFPFLCFRVRSFVVVSIRLFVVVLRCAISAHPHRQIEQTMTTQTPPKKSDAKNHQPSSPWIKSKAKAKLRSLLLDESSWIQICSPEQIHAGDDDFKQYPFARLKVNFNNLKAAIELNRRCVLFDEGAVEHQNECFPRNPTTERGYKFWNTHPAEKRLKELIKEGGDAANKKPAEIQQDHPDFQDFPSHVFLQHIYQEKRICKEGAFWQKKRNEKAHKNHRDAEERRRNEL
jgi:hypothetical protein